VKKILVVVDMQKDFVDGALGTKEAQKIVAGVAERINGFFGDIIVTYDTHADNYMQTSEGKNLPVPHCIKGTDGWALDSRVQAAVDKKKVTVFEKPTFGSVALAEYVKEKYGDGVSIELIGLCTDICVVSNALLLKATLPEAEISVDSSLCAGVTPESHSAALTTMKMCQINVK